MRLGVSQIDSDHDILVYDHITGHILPDCPSTTNPIAAAQLCRKTLAARFSKKSFSRCLASGLVSAIEAISDSVRSPLAGSLSKMRGRACSTAKLVVGVLEAAL